MEDGGMYIFIGRERVERERERGGRYVRYG